MMKAVIVKAHGEFKVGTEITVTAAEFAVLADAGTAVTATEWQAQQTITATEQAAVKAREKRVDDAIGKAIANGSILPKADNSTIRAHALTMEAASEGVGVEFLLSLPVKAGQDNLGTRQITPSKSDNVLTASGVIMGEETVQEACQGVVKATAPQEGLIRSGNYKEAMKLAKEVGNKVKYQLMKPVHAGGNYMLNDVIRGATFVDPSGTAGTAYNVGSLAGDLVVMRNLGYLVNKLAWVKKLTTDLTGEPVRFGQTILSRYITPPGVLTWVPGVGFTNPLNVAGSGGFGAQQISDSGTGTTQSAGHTLGTDQGGNYELDATNNFGLPSKSYPLTTDVPVTLNMFKATEIEFPVSLLSGTARNLLGEQIGAQTYTLAEVINQYMLGIIFAGTWTGTKTSYTKALANWNLSGMIGVKNAMSISKIPDVGRFVLLHSFYHDKLLEDANLLSAKAILALINKDESSFENGELPSLFGVKPLESQLASATSAGALTTWTDDTTLGTTVMVGFAGNMSSALFVSRPPQDFTQTATQLGIPVTANVRLVTEPDSGLTVMVFSYLDNSKMSISQRVCLMYGGHVGDPRVGIVIKAA